MTNNEEAYYYGQWYETVAQDLWEQELRGISLGVSDTVLLALYLKTSRLDCFLSRSASSSEVRSPTPICHRSSGKLPDLLTMSWALL